MTQQLTSTKAASFAELADVKAAVEREKARADAAARDLAAAADQVAAARARASKEVADAKAARDQEKAGADAMTRDIAKVVEQLSAAKATAAALDREKEPADAAQRELETARQQIAARQRGAGDIARAEQPGVARAERAGPGRTARGSLPGTSLKPPTQRSTPVRRRGELNLASLPPVRKGASSNERPPSSRTAIFLLRGCCWKKLPSRETALLFSCWRKPMTPKCFRNGGSSASPATRQEPRNSAVPRGPSAPPADSGRRFGRVEDAQPSHCRARYEAMWSEAARSSPPAGARLARSEAEAYRSAAWERAAAHLRTAAEREQAAKHLDVAADDFERAAARLDNAAG